MESNLQEKLISKDNREESFTRTCLLSPSVDLFLRLHASLQLNQRKKA